ncbi:MAG: hypothetical protein MUF84_09060 [Anaerolineae bacterium]|jgi:hypothetical protein|nr:hypothetical protein [Anaerolineae bacterium]
MPIPTIRFPNNERATQSVIRHIGALTPPVRNLRPRPSDSSARAFADWWLLAGSHRSMVGHGRLYLRREPGTMNATTQGLMSLGLRVERGLGRQLASAGLGEVPTMDLVDPQFVMQSTWLWYRFLNDAVGGLFDPPLRTVLTRSGQPVTIDLDLYRAESVPAAIAARVLPDDRLSFVVLDDTLLLHPVRIASDELSELNDAATLRELVLRIESVRDLPWYWLVTSIGIQVAYGDEDGDWDAGDLWHRALEPWLPWVH